MKHRRIDILAIYHEGRTKPGKQKRRDEREMGHMCAMPYVTGLYALKDWELHLRQKFSQVQDDRQQPLEMHDKDHLQHAVLIDFSMIRKR